nr:ESPR domain-containing protein [Escherichia coli]
MKRHLNTCYRLVWNHITGAFVVASELARARGKRGATPGTPRRSSHMRHSWLNFIFRGYKKTMGRAVRKTSGHRDLTRPSPLAVGTGSYFSRSRAVFAL